MAKRKQRLCEYCNKPRRSNHVCKFKDADEQTAAIQRVLNDPLTAYFKLYMAQHDQPAGALPPDTPAFDWTLARVLEFARGYAAYLEELKERNGTLRAS